MDHHVLHATLALMAMMVVAAFTLSVYAVIQHAPHHDAAGSHRVHSDQVLGKASIKSTTTATANASVLPTSITANVPTTLFHLTVPVAAAGSTVSIMGIAFSITFAGAKLSNTKTGSQYSLPSITYSLTNFFGSSFTGDTWANNNNAEKATHNALAYSVIFGTNVAGSGTAQVKVLIPGDRSDGTYSSDLPAVKFSMDLLNVAIPSGFTNPLPFQLNLTHFDKKPIVGTTNQPISVLPCQGQIIDVLQSCST